MTYRFHSFFLCVLTILMLPTHATSEGFDLSTAPCGRFSSPLGQFSLSIAQYTATGQCTTSGSLGTGRTFPYTVKGSFSNGIAEEVIEILPAAISEPSHPSGKWTTRYSCASDPWLTPDGPPYEASVLKLKCPFISRTGPTPTQEGPSTSADGKKLPTIGQWFIMFGSAKPMTAWTLTPAERQSLMAKREADLAKERTSKRLKSGLQEQTPFRASLAPLILSPSPGQRFFEQTPVPIKLAPPNGWMDQTVNLDGTPHADELAKRGYAIELQRRMPDGTWIIHPTGGNAVRASEAESRTGYQGFGAGNSPVMKTVPGTWRIRAQMRLPIETGWSNWVEFVVMAPVTAPSNRVQKAPKMFGQ